MLRYIRDRGLKVAKYIRFYELGGSGLIFGTLTFSDAKVVSGF